MELPPAGDIKRLRVKNLELTRKKIRESINEDNYISHAINSIDETDKAINMLAKRLREWYSLYNPEFPKSIEDNEKFIELILRKSKKELLKEIHVTESLGKDLKKEDLGAILNLGKKIQEFFVLRKETEDYLDKLMKSYCKNIQTLAGSTIAARLIEHTGSLKRLALLPASTIQILGAEKALFRHITKGSRPPKYGLIYNHQFIQQAKKKEQGKRSRALADKLAICARADFFKGKFIADDLKKQLDKKFK